VVGPHAAVARFTITVAAGKKMVVEHYNANIIRLGVATVAGEIDWSIGIASGAATAVLARGYSFTNTSNVQTGFANGCAVTVYAGETVTGSTADGSTGGTILFDLSVKATIFDA